MMTACMCARVARNPDFRPLVQSLGSKRGPKRQVEHRDPACGLRILCIQTRIDMCLLRYRQVQMDKMDVGGPARKAIVEAIIWRILDVVAFINGS